MKHHTIALIGCLICLTFFLPSAQGQMFKVIRTDTFGKEVRIITPRTFYLSSGADASIFSTSTLSRPGRTSNRLTTPRYTSVLHIGAQLNYDISAYLGLYTGLGIKNIGFIEKYFGGDSTVIRRVYTLGVPLGIKLGKVNQGKYFFLGGGLDMPFHYKEKGFVKRGDKDKTREWFSQRTPTFMPNIFVGYRHKTGLKAKLQYYPGNFMDPNYTRMEFGSQVRPYRGYDVQLIMLSLGMDIPYHRKHKEHWKEIQ